MVPNRSAQPVEEGSAQGIVSPNKCRLCRKDAQLRKGHIIPRFAVKWLKKTSLTGYMRDLVSGRRQQETKCEFILCSECEKLLAVDEKHFSERIFIPYHERGQKRFEYGPWLKRFLVGLHWRVLIASKVVHSPQIQSVFDGVAEVWRNFLLGQRSNPGEYEFHVFFADVVETATRSIPKKFNWYMARGFDATPAFSDAGQAFVYAKLIKLVTVSFLTPRDPQKENWNGTLVSETGTLLIPQQLTTSSFGRFLEERARLMEQAPFTLTPRQLEKLFEQAKENPESILSSESYKVHLADRELKQRIAIQSVIKGRDRNRPCFCGSGLKAKKCCGV